MERHLSAMADPKMVVLELQADRYPSLRIPANASERQQISCENAVIGRLGRKQRVKDRKNRKLQHDHGCRPRKLPLLALRRVRLGLKSEPIEPQEAPPALEIQVVKMYRQKKLADG